MSKFKKILSVILCMLLVVSAAAVSTPASALAKSEPKPSDYVSSSTLNVSNVMIGLTPYEMKKKVGNDAETSFADASFDWSNQNLSFNENGCLIAFVYVRVNGGHPSIGLYTSKEQSKTYLSKDGWSNFSLDNVVVPVDGESSVYISKSGCQSKAYGWFDFVPTSSMIKPDYCEENDDGTYTFYLKNVNKDIDYSTVCAFDSALTAQEAYTQLNNSKMLGSSTSTGAKIKLPKKGVYTLVTTVYMEDGSSLIFSFVVKTSDYAKKSAKKVDKPLAAFAGTNVIVGKAAADATVNCAVAKKTYKAQANDLGVYVIKLDKALVKGDSFKIWQKNGKMVSAKRAVKVSE